MAMIASREGRAVDDAHHDPISLPSGMVAEMYFYDHPGAAKALKDGFISLYAMPLGNEGRGTEPDEPLFTKPKAMSRFSGINATPFAMSCLNNIDMREVFSTKVEPVVIQGLIAEAQKDDVLSEQLGYLMRSTLWFLGINRADRFGPNYNPSTQGQKDRGAYATAGKVAMRGAFVTIPPGVLMEMYVPGPKEVKEHLAKPHLRHDSSPLKNKVVLRARPYDPTKRTDLILKTLQKRVAAGEGDVQLSGVTDTPDNKVLVAMYAIYRRMGDGDDRFELLRTLLTAFAGVQKDDMNFIAGRSVTGCKAGKNSDWSIYRA